MMQEGARQRLQVPDLLKGLAVLFMIQVHIMELFVKESTQEGAAGVLSLFLGGVPAAPVFMAVMGYFVGFRGKDPTALAFRGLKLFLAGMLLNIGLNFHLILKVIFGGWGATVNIWQYIFGVDILHLAGLSLMVMALWEKLFQRKIIPWLVLLLAVSVIPAIASPHPGDEGVRTYLMAFIHSGATWSYFPLLPWLAYPLAGYLFFVLERKYQERIDTTGSRAAIGVLLTVFLAFTLNNAAQVMHDLPAYYHHGPRFVFWALAFVTWWAIVVAVAERFAGRTGLFRYIKWLGRHVTTVYVFQWLIIGNMATSVYKTFDIQTAAVWFVVILIFTSLLTIAWNKLNEAYPLRIL